MLRSILSGNIGLAEIVIYLLSTLAVIFITLPIHEFAHGFAAVKLGDNTPRWQGRLTLNPFAHIDYVGAICILFFGFGWARPVQVNHYNFRNPKRDMAITALAGPLANLIVALVSFFAFYGFTALSRVSEFLFYIAIFFLYIANINIYLAVFNLIPIPPLDGSRLLSAFLPSKYYYALMRYERFIFWGLIALLWLGVLDAPLDFLSDKVSRALEFIASLPFRLFLN